MAGVMSLSSADGGAIGALAGPLERSLHFGNTRLGLLVTVSSLVGAAGCMPMGILVDRLNRRRLLGGAILLWSVAMVSMAMAGSYGSLLLSRMGLGLVTSAAGPVVASLTGDLFPAGRRARIYGLMLTGDILGTGIGLLGSTTVQSVANWRAAFLALAAGSLALLVVVHILLEEPARGLQESHGPAAASDKAPVPAGETRPPAAAGRAAGSATCGPNDVDPRLVVSPEEARTMGWWRAARYVLRIPTNRVLIVSSALGYFFLSGLRTFAVMFARAQFGLGQVSSSILIVVVGAGTLAGTVAGGRIADRGGSGRRPEARMLVAGGALAGAAVLFVPGLFTRSVAVALPLYIGAAALLAAPNAPLDAARLDIVAPRLWGRAEAVRSVARTLLEGAAPLLFGFVSSQFSAQFSDHPVNAAAGTSSPHQTLTPASAHGLALTFTVMLLPLAASGVLLIRRRGRYRIDVASAMAGNGSAQEIVTPVTETIDRKSATPDLRPINLAHRASDIAM